MGAQLRIYRRRMRSVKATKKITKAMELISASRIVKAQQKVAASSPYANELTRAVSAVASLSSTNHPLTTESANPKRAAVLIITADRGMAGAYSNAAIKEGDQLVALLESRGLEVNPYLVGRKGINFYKFRNRKITQSWSGFSDNPTYAHAKEVSDSLIAAFEYAPAIPRSAVIINTAARFGLADAVVNGWLVLDKEATAETARVNSLA